MLHCTEESDPKFEPLTITQNNQIEFLGKNNLSLEQLSKLLDSLIKDQGDLYLELDVNEDSEYSRFYKIRNLLQRHRDKLLVSLKHPTNQINYYTISAEPDIAELDRFTKIQTIEINKWEKDRFTINNDSTVLKRDLKKELLTKSNALLKEQINNTDKVLMYWVNLSSPTTNAEYKYLREILNQTIKVLKNENEDLITRIIELQQTKN